MRAVPSHPDLLDEGMGHRNELTTLAQTLNVNLDRLPNELEDFFPRLSNRNAPWKIGDVRPNRNVPLLEDDDVFHRFALVLPQPRLLPDVKERAKIAAELLSSLDEQNEDVKATWAVKIVRRAADAASDPGDEEDWRRLWTMFAAKCFRGEADSPPPNRQARFTRGSCLVSREGSRSGESISR
jgi:hypothetical protein